MGRAKGAMSGEDKKRILTLLQTSEEFDHFLHTKFRGTAEKKENKNKK
jgi:2-oxoglutarate dehydrogenase complex dehydrogenase (E1) component-like enzyme